MAEELKRDFKGIWIPKDIWLDENLNKMQMLLYVEIDSLSSTDKGCFASNKHFASFLRITPSRASQLVSELKSKGYIKIKLFYAPDNPKQVIKREIYPVNKLNRVVNKFDDPTKDINSPYLINCEESNTSSLIHISNKDIVEQAQPDIPYSQIIEYLNQKTSKHFKNTKNNQKLIRDVFSDGFNFEDIKHVINNMVVNWGSDDKMSTYLRPSTLFGDKFEEYLNSAPMNKRKIEKSTNWEQLSERSDNLNEDEYDKRIAELKERLRNFRSKEGVCE